MWLTYSFVIEFAQTFTRLIDSEYAPNAGSDLAADVKLWMDEAIAIRVDRIELIQAIDKLKLSIKDVERVNKDIQRAY